MRNFLLHYLSYRFKSSIVQESLKNTNTGPLNDSVNQVICTLKCLLLKLNGEIYYNYLC